MSMHQSTMDMISSVWGQRQEPLCKVGTNRWDAYIAEVQSKNETVRFVADKGFGWFETAVEWISGAWAVTEVAKNIGDDVGGNKTEAGRDGVFDSDNSSFEGTGDINDEDRAWSVGGENSSVSNNPDDSANSETIIMPEETE
ncbi:MAG: hypothetical protein ACK5M8_20345 [Shewanella algae]